MNFLNTIMNTNKNCKKPIGNKRGINHFIPYQATHHQWII